MTGLVSRISALQWSWYGMGARQHRRLVLLIYADYRLASAVRLEYSVFDQVLLFTDGASPGNPGEAERGRQQPNDTLRSSQDSDAPDEISVDAVGAESPAIEAAL